MASQPDRQASHRALVTEIEADERRSWLSYGLAALGISALGLAAAGSIALTTSAQTTETAGEARTLNAVSSPAPTRTPPASMGERQAAAINTFTRRPNLAADDADRTPTLRTAIVKERSAQRAEELAKGADDIIRTERVVTRDARQDQLRAANRASGLAAAKLAEEKLRRAVAARVAASMAREARERAEAARTSDSGRSATPTRTSARPAETSRIYTGGGAVSPVPGAIIGTRFGVYGIWSRYHTGLDFRAAYGTPIRAVKSGVVLFAGNTGDWAGNHVAIRHADGRTTMSSHMSSMAVGSGQTVRAGQVIGYVGETGRAFGAHLHFELYPAGVRYGDVYKAIDPQPWLAANGVQTR